MAAGGRYDNLVNMFAPKSQIPCVGISFGIDRIFAITKMRLQADKNAEKLRKNDVDVYVMAFGGGKDFTGFLKERSQICSRLWKAGVKVSDPHFSPPLVPPFLARHELFSRRYPGHANSEQAEFLYKVKPKLQAQFKAAEANGTPFALILGESELADGLVRMKELGLPDGHPEKDGVLIKLDDLENEVLQRLARKKALDDMTKQAEGLRVVRGIKGEDVKIEPTAESAEQPAPASSAEAPVATTS